MKLVVSSDSPSLWATLIEVTHEEQSELGATDHTLMGLRLNILGLPCPRYVEPELASRYFHPTNLYPKGSKQWRN